MTRIVRHNVKGGWVARVHGYKETPRTPLDPIEEREAERYWNSAPAEFDRPIDEDCATAHKSDGKLFGPDSILRVPQVEIVEPIQPE